MLNVESFLDLASVRIAVVPTRYVSEVRFHQLAAHVMALREIPVSALPENGSEIRRKSFLYGDRKGSLENAYPETLAADIDANSHASGGSDDAFDQLNGRVGASDRDLPEPARSERTRSAKNTMSALLNAGSLSNARNGSVARPVEPFDESLEGEAKIHVRYELCRKTMGGSVLVPSASDLERFQAFKRIWGVVAIADLSDESVYHSVEEQDAAVCGALEDLTVVTQQLRTANVCKLVVFVADSAIATWSADASFALEAQRRRAAQQLEQEQSAPNPNGRSSSSSAGPSGRSVSTGFVADHVSSAVITRAEVRVQVLHLIGCVLDRVEEELRTLQSSDAPIVTHMDATNTPDAQYMVAKRREGRLHKLLGDFYLLLGLPSDAVKHYKVAGDSSRTNSDRLWLAGTIESETAALLVHSGFSCANTIHSAPPLKHADGGAAQRNAEQEGSTSGKGERQRRSPDNKEAPRKAPQARLVPVARGAEHASKSASASGGAANGDAMTATQEALGLRLFTKVAPTVIASIAESMADAQRLYARKKVKDFEVAASVRLGALLAAVPGYRREALDAASRAYQVAETLRMSRKVQVWGALAALFEALGAHRKAELVLYRLAKWNSAQERFFEAYSLMCRVSALFRRRQWIPLQLAIAYENTSLASNAGFLTDAASRAVDYLSLAASDQLLDADTDLAPERSADGDRSSADIVVSPLVPEMAVLDGTSGGDGSTEAHVLDSLRAWSLEEVVESLSHVLRVESCTAVSAPDVELVDLAPASSSTAAASAGPFIYSAIDDEALKRSGRTQQATWLVGETAHVELRLRTTLKCEVSIQLVDLLVRDVLDRKSSRAGLTAGGASAGSVHPTVGLSREQNGRSSVDADDETVLELEAMIEESRSLLQAREEVVHLKGAGRQHSTARAAVRGQSSCFRVAVVPQRAAADLQVYGMVFRGFGSLLGMCLFDQQPHQPLAMDSNDNAGESKREASKNDSDVLCGHAVVHDDVTRCDLWIEAPLSMESPFHTGSKLGDRIEKQRRRANSTRRMESTSRWLGSHNDSFASSCNSAPCDGGDGGEDGLLGTSDVSLHVGERRTIWLGVRNRGALDVAGGEISFETAMLGCCSVTLYQGPSVCETAARSHGESIELRPLASGAISWHRVELELRYPGCDDYSAHGHTPSTPLSWPGVVDIRFVVLHAAESSLRRARKSTVSLQVLPKVAVELSSFACAADMHAQLNALGAAEAHSVERIETDESGGAHEDAHNGEEANAEVSVGVRNLLACPVRVAIVRCRKQENSAGTDVDGGVEASCVSLEGGRSARVEVPLNAQKYGGCGFEVAIGSRFVLRWTKLDDGVSGEYSFRDLEHECHPALRALLDAPPIELRLAVDDHCEQQLRHQHVARVGPGEFHVVTVSVATPVDGLERSSSSESGSQEFDATVVLSVLQEQGRNKIWSARQGEHYLISGTHRLRFSLPHAASDTASDMDEDPSKATPAADDGEAGAEGSNSALANGSSEMGEKHGSRMTTANGKILTSQRVNLCFLCAGVFVLRATLIDASRGETPSAPQLHSKRHTTCQIVIDVA